LSFEKGRERGGDSRIGVQRERRKKEGKREGDEEEEEEEEGGGDSPRPVEPRHGSWAGGGYRRLFLIGFGSGFGFGGMLW